jgi:hypothetical protein
VPPRNVETEPKPTAPEPTPTAPEPVAETGNPTARIVTNGSIFYRLLEAGLPNDTRELTGLNLSELTLCDLGNLMLASRDLNSTQYRVALFGSEGMPLTKNLYQNTSVKCSDVIGNKHLVFGIVTPSTND